MANKQGCSYNEVKKHALKSRCTVASVKDAMRKQFRDRLKQLRNEKTNKNRNLVSEIVNIKNFANLQIDSTELTSVEILQILDEVETELKLELSKSEFDQYEEDTNAIIEGLLQVVNNTCPICQNVLSQNYENTAKLCQQCSESFNSQ